jgi:chromosome segregation ATPase
VQETSFQRKEMQVMGVERAVTRWYLQRQTLINEVAALESQIMQARQQHEQRQEPVGTADQTETGYLQQLTQAQRKLRLLGPCPKPMMG